MSININSVVGAFKQASSRGGKPADGVVTIVDIDEQVKFDKPQWLIHYTSNGQAKKWFTVMYSQTGTSFEKWTEHNENFLKLAKLFVDNKNKPIDVKWTWDLSGPVGDDKFRRERSHITSVEAV